MKSNKGADTSQYQPAGGTIDPRQLSCCLGLGTRGVPGQCVLTICELGMLVIRWRAAVPRQVDHLSAFHLSASIYSGKGAAGTSLLGVSLVLPHLHGGDVLMSWAFFGSPGLGSKPLLAGCVTLGKSLLSSLAFLVLK